MMPAAGSAANRPWTPPGMKPPVVKLPPWNLNSKTMMARTGIATFHTVTALLTRANSRMARKLTAVKKAISAMVTQNPAPVTFPAFESYRLGQ